MTQKIIVRILVFIGIVNSSILIISALTGSNAYVIGYSLSPIMKNLVLCFIPLFILSCSFIWFLIDLKTKPLKKVNYFLLAFCGISADAVFVIGSHFFAQGH